MRQYACSEIVEDSEAVREHCRVGEQERLGGAVQDQLKALADLTGLCVCRDMSALSKTSAVSIAADVLIILIILYKSIAGFGECSCLLPSVSAIVCYYL